jgi:Tfp pilus assembly PilM family ATPase
MKANSSGEPEDMLGILTKTTGPIGVDLNHDLLMMAQLAKEGEEMMVFNCKSVAVMAHDPPDCPQWHRSAVDAIRYARAESHFRGKDIVAALPTTDLFVDCFKCPQPSDGKLENAIFSKMRGKLPAGWTQNNIVTKCIPTEQDNILVVVAHRTTINRCLAIYDRAHLNARSIVAWPVAMAKCYGRVFAQSAHDLESVVMLVDIQSEYTRVMACRGGNPLLANSIPTGIRRLSELSEADRLAWELSVFRKQLISLYRDMDIERVIFLSGALVSREVYHAVGAKLSIRVQIADCRAALREAEARGASPLGDTIQMSWTLAFGLSLCGL